MKRNTTLLLTLIGISGIVLVAQSVLPKGDRSEDTVTPEVSGSLYMVYEEEGQSSIDIDIKRTGHEVLDDWVKNRATEIEAQYREDVDSMIDLQEWQQPMLRVLSSTSEWDVYVSAVIDVYAYTGGVHGLPYIQTAVLNKETGALAGLGDVFGTAEYLPQLSQLMIGKVSDLNEVFDGDTVREALQPSATNFELWNVGPDGVTFFYNPYEVAPFSTGIVSVLVTWEEIQAFKK